MCALRIQSTTELDRDQQISLTSHTSLQGVRLVAHEFAPQVEFELLEGMQHQLDKTSGSLFCVQRDCAVNFIARKLYSYHWTRVKPSNRFSQYFNSEYCAQARS